MSMPVNHIRSLALSALPLILLIVLTGVVLWTLNQTEPFSVTRRLAVHQALQNLPAENFEQQFKELLPKDMFSNQDPFFRVSPPEPVSHSAEEQETVSALQEMHLTTIAQGKSGRYCLINGRIYNEGSSGQGFTVEYVEPDYVVISTPEETFNLTAGQKISLENGKILRPAKDE